MNGELRSDPINNRIRLLIVKIKILTDTIVDVIAPD